MEDEPVIKKHCLTAKCRGVVPEHRRYCNHCRAERDKARDPEKYAYRTLKANAKRRKKVFAISLEEFRAFCYKTSLLVGRGRTADSWHIDRIRDNEGYTASNIQVLTNSQNITKENNRRKREKILYYDYKTKRGNFLEVKPIDTSLCAF